MTSTDDSAGARPDAELRLPADGAFASVLRTTTASLAARLDFTIDDIEDLRMAAAEAAALVLPGAEEGGELVARFHLRPDRITLEVGVDAQATSPPDRESFAWQVLETLATGVELGHEDDRWVVRLTMVSSTAATTG